MVLRTSVVFDGGLESEDWTLSPFVWIFFVGGNGFRGDLGGSVGEISEHNCVNANCQFKKLHESSLLEILTILHGQGVFIPRL